MVGVAAGAALRVQVSAHAGSISGLPAEADTMWLVPPEPLSATLALSGAMSVSWQAPAAGHSIKLLLADANNQPLSPQPVFQITRTQARCLLDPVPESALQVVLASVLGGNASAWSPPMVVTVQTLAPPVITKVHFDLKAFVVVASWTATEEAAGCRMQLLDDKIPPEVIASGAMGTALTGQLPAGTRAGFMAGVQVAALPLSGQNEVWSAVQPVTIPGAAVKLSLAAPPVGHSAEGLSFTVTQDQPPGAPFTLTLEPGDSGKPVGTAPVAAFTATRTVPLPAGAGLLQRFAYTVSEIFPSIAIDAPLAGDWPTPDGTALVADWGVSLTGGAELWHRQHSATAIAMRVTDVVAAPADRLAIAVGMDTWQPDACMRASLFALVHEPEADSALLARSYDGIAAFAAAVQSTFAAIGQPLDIVTFARLLVAAYPSAGSSELAEALSAQTENSPPGVIAAACRVAGMTLAEAAAQIHRFHPDLTATDLARALVGAWYATDALFSYGAALANQALPASVAGRRMASLVAVDIEPLASLLTSLRVQGIAIVDAAVRARATFPAAGATQVAMALVAAYYRPQGANDGLAKLLVMLRVQGTMLAAAALRAHSAFPAVGATELAVALAAAYFEPPTASAAGVAALARAFGPPKGSQQRLAWALLASGVAANDLSPLVDATFSLAPDSGARAAALAVLFAPDGAASLRARLAADPGSPLAAVKTAAGHFAALEPAARVVVAADAYFGTTARPTLLAAALALGGTGQSDTIAALELLLGVDSAAAAAAWNDGQILAALYA
jgi:hypothetical protein